MKLASRIALVAVFALLLLPLTALATGKPPATTPGSEAHSAASSASTSNAAANATGGAQTMMNSGGDAWAVALPGHGSPSYAGQFSICVRGRGVFFNAFWSWDPDLECVKLIAEVTRLAATPKPMPAVYPTADTAKPVASIEAPKPEAAAACAPPAKAKSVAAAKAAGACKT